MKRARVIAEYRASYDVLYEDTVFTASLRGHFHEATTTGFPKVGDYVAVVNTGDGRLVIEAVFPRLNYIARLAPHDNTLQVMVANVDYILIVMGLDGDFNIPRLERYMALAAQSNVAPVIILNKSDIALDVPTQLRAVTAVTLDAPVVVVSAITGVGMELLLPYVQAGKTVVLLGSSGAGKSTITNYLVATAAQPISGLRERDGRGRHTTTHRQLFVLRTGGFLIDTPGMRELALVSEVDAAADAFADIEALANKCRFRNCDHNKSDGCALKKAVQQGTLEPARLTRYIKLRQGGERLRRVRY